MNAKADLSGDMALRFEKAFGVHMDTLMRMQNSYDIAKTRKRAKSLRVEPYEPHSAAWLFALTAVQRAAVILNSGGIGG